MSDDTHEAANIPGVMAPPPLIYAGALAIGLLAKALFPSAFLPRPAARSLGWPLTGGGLLLGLLGYRALRGAKTNVSPYEPTTALVTEGPTASLATRSTWASRWYMAGSPPSPMHPGPPCCSPSSSSSCDAG